jgi:hypothetical protein
MKPLISSGDAKITAARSPIMPARKIAGAPFAGPSSLESVLKRRLRSQKLRILPSADDRSALRRNIGQACGLTWGRTCKKRKG